jgi:heptosyltransferase-2
MKDIKYRFYPNTSGKTVSKIKLIDKLLYTLWRGTEKKFTEQAINKITIIQLAHIGDMILLLPALKALKCNSNYHVNLLVSSQNFNIASRLKYVDSVTVADAPYFARNNKVSYLSYINQLNKIKTDLIYDVRGDLRNNFFIRFFTRKKLFLGYDVGGGGAFLDVVLPFDHEGHVSGLLSPLFSYLKLPQNHLADYWSEEDMPYDEITDHIFPGRFLVVHIGTGAQARKWPVEFFLETIAAVSKEIPVYVLGLNQDLTVEQLKTISEMPNVVTCIGKYSILQSIYILKKCSLFLGLDSGFSHIAALLKKKVIILFSGTVNKKVWKPFSFFEDQIVLLNKEVPCDYSTGCGKLVCDDNICMKQIKPAEVIGKIKVSLNDLKLIS